MNGYTINGDEGEPRIRWSEDITGDGDFDDLTDVLNVYSLRIVGDYDDTPSYDVYLSEANSATLALIADDCTLFKGDAPANKGITEVRFRPRNSETRDFLVDEVSLATIPEPSTLALLAVGAVLLLWRRRRSGK